MPYDPKKCFCRGNCRANKAVELNQKGETEKAYSEARQAVLNAPKCPFAHGILGSIMMNSENAAVYAERHIRISHALGDQPAIAETQLGYCLMNQGLIRAAAQAFTRAIGVNPNYLQAQTGLAKTHEIQGDYDAARTLCEQVHSADPNVPFNDVTYAKVLCHFKEYDKAIDILSREPDPIKLYERGKIHEKCERYGVAWTDYVNANLMTKKTYDDAEAARRIANHKAFTGITTLERLPTLDAPGALPVQPLFITGFPRSGTTLVETLFSAHPKIQAGDELKFLLDIAGFSQTWLGADQPYPFALNELVIGDKTPILRAFRTYYMSKVMDLYDHQRASQYIADKMPLNEMHLPLMALLFPGTPILHIRRNPMDIILSNFSTFLTHGFNQSFGLVSCATHYSRVDGLVQHYKNKVQMDFTEIRYEALINDPEKIMRYCLEHIGLMFDEACIKPESNPHYPRTPSYYAVKKPINDNSIGRWRKFETYMGDALRIVEPIMKRENYA